MIHARSHSQLVEELEPNSVLLAVNTAAGAPTPIIACLGPTCRAQALPLGVWEFSSTSLLAQA